MTIGFYLISAGILNLIGFKLTIGDVIIQEPIHVLGFSELKPINSTVTVIIVLSNDHASVVYTPLNPDAIEFIKFTNDNDNGVVTLKKQLDADDRSKVDSTYKFVFSIKGVPGNFERLRTLDVFVTDENDEKPSFLSAETLFKVNENNNINYFLHNFSAIDNDLSPDFSYISFSLEPDDFLLDGTFYLTTFSHLGGGPDGARVGLYLHKSLDYEEKRYYFFKLVAKDGKYGIQNNVSLNIVLEVQDVQDMPPEFTRAPAIAHVKEDKQLGQIEQFTAIDGDKGKPNQIKYNITSFNPANGALYFSIDPNKGTIYLKESLINLDLQLYQMFTLQIMAIEISNPPLEYEDNTTVSFTIFIDDVNNNAPEFQENCVNAEIEENSAMNIPITFIDHCENGIYINDKDLGDNAKYKTYLKYANNTFVIAPKQGVNEAIFLIKVDNNTLLDYEQHQSLSFQMFAEETDTEERHKRFKSITLNIINVNDHSPVFTEDDYNFSFLENPRANTFVGKVQATDDDLGLFGMVAYTRLYGNSEPKLTLNYQTGIITVTEDDEEFFDREKIAQLFISVEAQDNNGTEPNNKAMAQIHITLIDVNDNKPIFAQNQYEANLKENSPDFDKPLIVLATDADEGLNAEVNYKIIGGNGLNNFTINKTSGTIQPTRPVDFEAMEEGLISDQRLFTLIVMAYDLGTPSLNNNVTVLINVQDVNDNAPIFQPSIYYSEINETVNLHNDEQWVTRVNATDFDGTAPFNQISYRISSGSENKFMLNYENIHVTPSAQLDYDKKRNYVLMVIGLDGGIGSQQLNGTCMVNVTIKDMNNKDPSFGLRKETVAILEDKPIQFILTDNMTASDEDSTASLRYSILGYEDPQNENGNILTDKAYYENLFSVNELTGVISVKSALDRETMEKIKIILSVQDINANTDYLQTATALLTVIIEDVNDNDPIFRLPDGKDYYENRVFENSRSDDSIIRTFSAYDIDKNRTITYSFADDKDISAQVFKLNSETGELSVRGDPIIDRETHEWVNFTILATDNGIPTRSSHATVFIYVIDLNDNSPNFTYYEPNISIKEHEPIGTYLTYVAAYDLDSGDYGRITFLLDPESRMVFAIHPDNGNISVSADIDREKTSAFGLKVIAKDDYRDGRNPESNSAEVTIIVKIIDINDQIPEIKSKASCYEINEDQAINTYFDKIDSYDADEPDTNNSKVELTLHEDLRNDSKYFGITKDGDLFLRLSVIDKVGKYFITVIATDLGDPPLSSNKTIMICVNDINNHAPQIHIPKANEIIAVLESATKAEIILQVIATDDDFDEDNKKLKYELEDMDNQDDKTFDIHTSQGFIKLHGELSIQQKKVYQYKLIVSDHGSPKQTNQQLFRFLIIVNDTTPYFKLGENKFNLTEHKKGPEDLGIFIEAEFQDNEYISKSFKICYFKVGGDDIDDKFIVNKTTREIKLKEDMEVDREEKPSYNLVILALASGKSACDEDVSISETISFDKNNQSMTLVTIDIDDINDQPPVFSQKKYSGGIRVADPLNSPVHVDLVITDKDLAPNDVNYFFILGKIYFDQKDTKWDVPVFRIDQFDGKIYTNVVFPQTLSGYFNFTVIANDSTNGDLNNTADVSIYLLRDQQKIKITIKVTSGIFNKHREWFKSIIGDITGGTVNIDEVTANPTDEHRTDVHFHVIKDEKIMDPAYVLRLMDENDKKLYEINSVLQIVDSGFKDATANIAGFNWLALVIGLSSGLGLLLLLIFSICLAQRSWYRRKLRASSVKAFTDDDNLDTNQLVVPGTNLHQFEGSNPIWQQSGYNNMFLREDNISLRSENESLDNNAVLSGSEKNPNFTTYGKPTRNNSIDYYKKPPPPNYEESESYHKKTQVERKYSTDL